MSGALSYLNHLSIGFNRACNSPGALFPGNTSVLSRLGAAALKTLNYAMVPLNPLGLRTEARQRELVCQASITQEQLETASDFFEAFSNPAANEFVRQLMCKNYSAAIMTHHPQADSLNPDSIEARNRVLVNSIFQRIGDISKNPHFLFDIITSMSRKHSPRDAIWFPEFDQAYEAYKHLSKPAARDELLSPFVSGNSLVDIGCGGGDLAARFRDNHSDVLTDGVAGIDVLDWKTPGLDIDYHVLDFSREGAAAPRSYDTGMLLAVLHHAGKTDNELRTFLAGVGTAVDQRLIVEEDSIITEEDLSILARSNVAGIKEFERTRYEQPAFNKFLGFDHSTQKAVITIIDLLSNALSVGVPEMAFPFGFRSVTEWKDLFASCGFDLERIKALGFQPGNFNQTSHVLYILNKSTH